ncbi:MAG: tRNA (N6-isopentenyl adenosine(37)-C2)-methylthiotransferase MiaB, partial [Pyrinomonadaceae bacterium]|nr:tRNA (N6-isopentenyl adenosine(37)-C2)-methylthiotransferase MiaB [Pyrinomonadaceae bacterium]
ILASYMKKVYLETFGCQMNVSDSERVRTNLTNKGFEITQNVDSADVVLFNTCSVREKAEHKLYTRVGRIRQKREVKPIVGVLGCVAQLEGETLFNKIEGVDLILGTKAVGRIDQAIEKVLDGEKKVLDLNEREDNYDWTVADKERHSPFVAFVPIIEGCNKFCTYCIVPFSRGREKSLPAAEIIRQILELRRQGVKEIHLIGQNVNSYRPKTDVGLEQFSGATPFSKLLRAVAATGIERIKFATSFPRDFHPDIVEAINENENLCNWVHLPVQSGSDAVLKKMRRGHTIENYKKRIDVIKNSPKNISLTTDVIVGFPGETEQDFQDTINLFEYCQYDNAYIFKYSPRFGTPSFEMEDDVSDEDKKRRFLELDQVMRASQKKSLQALVNKQLEVLVENKNEKNPEQLTGHTTCQRTVNIKGSDDLLGKIVKVKIIESKVNTLIGELC